MADSDNEELRQPAEEHQMQRGPVEMEGVTAMLPKLKFLESCTQDTDVAKEVALMAGFKLAVGPRVAFEFYNTIDPRDLDDMVSKSADTVPRLCLLSRRTVRTSAKNLYLWSRARAMSSPCPTFWPAARSHCACRVVHRE